MATPNTGSLIPHLRQLGMTEPEVHRVFRTFNAAAPEFLVAAEQAASASSEGTSGGEGISPVLP
jgi:sulfhydrogenase subunit delta